MQFLKDENRIRKIFMFFLIIQPILDIYILFTDDVVNFFKFSPSTIIRMLLIGILLIMVLLTTKFNKKYLWFILYGFLLLVYLVLHHINVTKFTFNPSSTYNYSKISELFYIIRMLLPYTVAFITYHVKLNKDQIYKIFMYFIISISATIVITNILCLSIESYSEGITLIKSNIFGWFFNYNYTNVDLSSKGIFTSANQMGSLLSLLLPITISYFFKREENKKLTIITLVLQTIAVLMIGTRISSYSWILIYIVMIVIYIYYVLRKKFTFNKKIFVSYVGILLFMFIIFTVAPINMRKYASDYKDVFVSMEEKSEAEQKVLKDKLSGIKNSNDIEKKEVEKDIKKFIRKNYENYSINKEYIMNIYSYKYDPVFWYYVMNLPFEERSDSRQIEQLITQHIYEQNNNKQDKWFGMGFSTFRNGNLYLEKDFKVHFYTLGLVGSLLLVYPYIIVLVIAGLYLLIKRRGKDNFMFLAYCFSISLMIIFGYVSGSVLDQLIITLICGFILGLIIKNMLKGVEYEES